MCKNLKEIHQVIGITDKRYDEMVSIIGKIVETSKMKSNVLENLMIEFLDRKELAYAIYVYGYLIGELDTLKRVSEDALVKSQETGLPVYYENEMQEFYFDYAKREIRVRPTIYSFTRKVKFKFKLKAWK